MAMENLGRGVVSATVDGHRAAQIGSNPSTSRGETYGERSGARWQTHEARRQGGRWSVITREGPTMTGMRFLAAVRRRGGRQGGGDARQRGVVG